MPSCRLCNYLRTKLFPAASRFSRSLYIVRLVGEFGHGRAHCQPSSPQSGFSHAARFNISSIISQIKAGWSFIMEGGISLINLIPVLPCLRNKDSQLIGNQDRVYSSSPLKIIFSFLPTPQKPLPKSFTLGKGNEVCCRVDFPRFCDAQADVFLEVRAPGNWDDNKAEPCFIFTWEFRSAALSREKIEQLLCSGDSGDRTTCVNSSMERGSPWLSCWISDAPVYRPPTSVYLPF